MKIIEMFRQMGLGKIAMALWHRPKAAFRNSWRNGGPFVERETERQREEMVSAAQSLPPLPSSNPLRAIPVHLLTGQRFWFQTAFCLHSLQRHSDGPVVPEIYDDGTFNDSLLERVEKFSPLGRIHRAREIKARLADLLPVSQFPVLRERWQNYPNIRKLIDPHIGSTGWKLIIDSDLLFFRRPQFILDWLAQPGAPLHAVDCAESYGYSRNLMEKLAGAPIPPLVNVGICGLRSEDINWPELEAWSAELIAREKTSYYLEQALVAMIAARHVCSVAPADQYITFPSKTEVMDPTAAMHHYVDTAKRWYFRYGWRHIEQGPPASMP